MNQFMKWTFSIECESDCLLLNFKTSFCCLSVRVCCVYELASTCFRVASAIRYHMWSALKWEYVTMVNDSLDSKNDYDKWRKMVIEKDIGGIQLYDHEGLDSEFMKAFSVSIIPRFMMIDSKGNIVTSNAPRPSSSEVRDYINNFLTRPKVRKFSNS